MSRADLEEYVGRRVAGGLAMVLTLLLSTDAQAVHALQDSVVTSKGVAWTFNNKPTAADSGTYSYRLKATAHDIHIDAKPESSKTGNWSIVDSVLSTTVNISAGSSTEPEADVYYLQHCDKVTGNSPPFEILGQIVSKVSTYLVETTSDWEHLGQKAHAEAKGSLVIKSGTITGAFLLTETAEGFIPIVATTFTGGSVVLSNKSARNKNWRDPIVIELEEIETGIITREQLFQFSVTASQGSNVTWDNAIGVVLDVPLGGAEASIKGGFNSPWIVSSSDSFSVSLENGIFTTSGTLSGLPWVLTTSGASVVKAELAPAYMAAMHVTYQIPPGLIVPAYHYQERLVMDSDDEADASCCPPAPAVDGSRNPAYPIVSSMQTTQTDFGDDLLGLPDFANGSELDLAAVTVLDDSLYLFLGGNLESNYNKLEIFFDTQPGGQNKLRGNNSNVDFNGLNRLGDDGSGNGLTFDAGFSPDYWLGLSGGDDGGGYRFFASFASLPSLGGGAGAYLGQTVARSDGTLAGGINPFAIRATLDNSNLTGVVGGCGGAAPDSAASGIEVALPLAALGSPTGCIRISAFINGGVHEFVSNQVLAPLPAPFCNLGDPRFVNFDLIPGNQYFEVCNVATVGVEPGPPVANDGISAWPNPSRGMVRLSFDSPAGEATQLDVFDIAGRKVKSFPRLAPGSQTFWWLGDGDNGRPLPTGTYFLRMRTGEVVRTRVLVRIH